MDTVGVYGAQIDLERRLDQTIGVNVASKFRLLFLTLAMMAGVLGGVPAASAAGGGDIVNLTAASEAWSSWGSVSADGSVAAYSQNGSVFVVDRSSGEVTEIFTPVDNEAGYRPQVSDDGSVVSFGAIVGDRAGDIFVWERATGEVTNITGGIGQSFDHTLSGDGNYVTFMNEVPTGVGETIVFNILIWERATGEFTNITSNVGETFRPSISGDGSYVAFESPEDVFPELDTNKTFDVFVWERATNEIIQVTQGTNGYSGQANISDDGSTVVFSSSATNLLPDGGSEGIFTWDRSTGNLARISDGFGNSPSVSADGSVVTFSTSGRFDQDPTNAIFVWTESTGVTTEITHGSNGPSTTPFISANGKVVAFSSEASNLTANDTNGARDIFIWTDPDPEPEPEPVNFACSQKAVSSNFDISWSGAPEGAVRFVVKRSVYGTFWWRGAVTEGNSFTDGPAPVAAASVYYQVVAQDQNRNTLATVGCSVAASDEFSCTVSGTANNGYLVEISGIEGANVDYVVRRTVTEGGTAFWRGRTTDLTFEDSKSPTGKAAYVVFARDNRAIQAIANCVEVGA